MIKKRPLVFIKQQARKLKKLKKARGHVLFFAFSILPCVAFAGKLDPISQMGQTIYGILFGTLGVALCGIIIGVTFILAKIGKVSWDQFLYVGFCAAGFLGTPSLIALIQSAIR